MMVIKGKSFLVYLIFLFLISCERSSVYKESSRWIYGSKVDIKDIMSRNGYLSEHKVFVNNNLLLKKNYTEQGKALLSVFYSMDGHECYRRYYDDSGNFKSFAGEPCYYGTLDNDTSKDFITERDTVVGVFFAPYEDKCNSSFWIVYNDSLFPLIYQRKDFEFIHYFKLGPLKKGTYEICYAYTFADSITKFSLRKDNCIKYKVINDIR